LAGRPRPDVDIAADVKDAAAREHIMRANSRHQCGDVGDPGGARPQPVRPPPPADHAWLVPAPNAQQIMLEREDGKP